jgi:MEDS: MEthanogen/methylotroph, DcmR Sensory domain/Histidine kinase-like ATPase domain
MATTAERAAHRKTDGFRHEALLYAGEDGFLEATLPWIREAVADEEPILVVVSAEKVARLRRELGADAERVAFADMAAVGANPGRIIPAWREFVDAHAGQRRRLRGIGEPISAQRSAEELVECQRHEALLNLVFAGAEDFWLLCPYDVDALDADVVEKAHHSHPTVVADGAARVSATYEDLGAVAAPFADPLPEPPADADELAFAIGTLGAVRRLVSERARDGGLDERSANDLVLAVNEAATNSIRHGGGRGVLRTFATGSVVRLHLRPGP